jgi:hypothetical protein
MLTMKYGISESLHADVNTVMRCYGMKKDWVPINRQKPHLLVYVAKMTRSVYQHIKPFMGIFRDC